MSKQSFFKDFEPISKEQWRDKIIKDLKGADFNEKLVWNTPEGFDVQPFYTQENTDYQPYTESLHQLGFDSEQAFLGARRWKYCQEIAVADEKKANEKALEVLNLGTETILFDLSNREEAPRWEVLLQGIQWAYCSVAFKSSDSQLAWAKGLAEHWESTAVDPESISGFWQASSIEGNVSSGKIFEKYTGFKGCSITHESSLALVSEKIGALLFGFYTAIEASEQEAAEVLAHACFQYQTDNNYFFQIAGIRALVLLTDAMVKSYGAVDHLDAPTIHAITSVEVSEATMQDPEWNMLSNTTQAMSAILGGCEYLSIKPHNQGITPVDDFSERVARNVSNLLREESYFDQVADPAAGAYYLEYLTDQLAAQAWEYFRGKL